MQISKRFQFTVLPISDAKKIKGAIDRENQAGVLLTDVVKIFDCNDNKLLVAKHVKNKD